MEENRRRNRQVRTYRRRVGWYGVGWGGRESERASERERERAREREMMKRGMIRRLQIAAYHRMRCSDNEDLKYC